MNKYKVGDKIVLTVSDVNEKAYYSYYVFNNNDLILWEPSTDKYAEPLSTYTEPLEAKIKRQTAEITRLLRENEKLKAENGNVIWEIEQAFDRGCNEAWELARKIVLPQSQGGMNDEDYIEAFGGGVSASYIMNNYTYSEAAAKAAEWEKGKEEVKVGDVLEDIADRSVKCVATSLYPNDMAYLVFSDGSAGMNDLDHFKKTGRHIDIDGFLMQIGGGDDEK